MIIGIPARHNPNTRNLEDTINALVYVLDESIKVMKGEKDKFVILFDMTGWGLRNSDLAFVRKGIEILQNYYPERAGTIFVVNPPTYVWALWHIVKNLLSEQTHSKIHFVKQESLLECFNKEDLNETLGGEKHEPKPLIDPFSSVPLEEQEKALLEQWKRNTSSVSSESNESFEVVANQNSL